jgi:pimeloyl-ACP methyl ester carboxylesterase
VTFARVQRRLLQTSAVAIFLVLAGATYQGVATAIERREFPHPGKMVDVGGHQLHIYCIGEGAPTIILEAPAAGMSAAWGWVQPQLAANTRACSYDRAGLGWSEAGDGSFDPAAVPGQLQALLEGAGERGPFVLVGQGFGAALARLDAARLGRDVVAAVLIDAPGSTLNASERTRTTRLIRISPWLARAGVLRATEMLSGSASGLPGPSEGALRAFLNRPDHLTRAGREIERWDETMSLAEAAPLPAHFVHVRTGLPEGVDVLADEREAAAATRAILEAVGP